MHSDVTGFVHDLARLLQEKYNETLEARQRVGSEADRAFHDGAGMAYYDALDLLAQQLAAFGYPTDKQMVPELGKPFVEGAAHKIELLWNGGTLSIELLGWIFPEASEVDEFSRDWLHCMIRGDVEGFSAHFPLDIMRSDLAGLRTTLQQLLASLGSETTGEFLQSYGGQLQLSFRMDRKGHVEVSGEVRFPADLSNQLSFRLEGDQTFLTPALEQLERALSAFPDRRSCG